MCPSQRNPKCTASPIVRRKTAYSAKSKILKSKGQTMPRLNIPRILPAWQLALQIRASIRNLCPGEELEPEKLLLLIYTHSKL
jgi:hypothetical protein